MAGGGVKRDVAEDTGLVVLLVSMSELDVNISDNVDVSDTGVTREGCGQ